eukprot:Seg1329.3 transcript_id=Seg1329.3/GoldUCD/mRNA.D3Y31 product="hypothetical protein" protein_id=Seg1329.3/GoldUCD/D3Y31
MGNGESTARRISMQRSDEGTVQISEDVMRRLQKGKRKEPYHEPAEDEIRIKEENLRLLLNDAYTKGKEVGEKMSSQKEESKRTKIEQDHQEKVAQIKDAEESVKLRNAKIGDLEQKIGEFKSFTETQLKEQQAMLESTSEKLEEEIKEKIIYKQQILDTASKLQEQEKLIESANAKLAGEQREKEECLQRLQAREESMKVEFNRGVEDVKKMLGPLQKTILCEGLQQEVIDCYKINQKYPLRCSKIVAEFKRCVEESRIVNIASSLAGARDTAFPVIKDKATTETRPNPISHLNREENREGEQEFSSNFVALGVRTSLCQSPAGIYFVTLNRDKSLILASIEEIQDCVKLATALWLGERREGCIDKWQEGVRPKSTNCLYLLKNSGTTYVPTFSSHLDFINKDIVLQPRYQSMAGVLHGGTCKATNIYYFDRNGREKTLFENSCSEIFGIRTKETSSGVTQHLLRWTYQGWSSTRVWDKLKGKLLSMKIVCTNPVMSQKAGSCLLFKVAGSYDDTFAYTTTKSPSVCPTAPTPKIKTTTTATTTTTTMRTSTTMKPITTATTSTTKLPTTKSTLKTSTTKVKVIPPATSPDFEPATVISVEKTEEAPVTKAQPNKEGKIKGMKGRNNGQKKGTNWLVTGLIVAVAILLIILAASMSVLVRKKCKKRRSLNERNGQVAMNLMYDGEHGLNFQTSYTS